MNKKSLDKYSATLNTIAKQASIDFKANIYPQKIFSSNGISVALYGDTAVLYFDLIRDLLIKENWQIKFSEKYIEKKINSLIALTFSQKNFDQTSKKLKEIHDEFISFLIEHTVVIPLFGLSVPEPIKIGKVEFFQLDNTKLDAILESMKNVFLATKNIDEEKQLIIEKQQNSILANFSNMTCSFFKVVAEPQRAKEIAEVETKRSLDILRFSIPFLFYPQEHVAIGLWGEISSGRRMSLIYSESRFSSDYQRIGPFKHFIINDDNINKIKQIGVFEFSKILEKPESILTEFERAITRSIHWFSTSLQQDQNENAFLNLLTSLEALLTPRDGNPIGTAIAEGCAFLLGHDIQSRKRLKKRIKEFYGKRSGVSHGGEKAILDQDLLELRAYWMAILSKLSKSINNWKSQKDFLEWIEDLKFESRPSEQ